MQVCPVRRNRSHQSEYFKIARKHFGLILVCKSQAGGLEAADAGNDESCLAAALAQSLLYRFPQIVAR